MGRFSDIVKTPQFQNLKAKSVAVGGFLLSLVLLGADYSYRWWKRLYSNLKAWLPSGARLFAIGCLSSGIVFGGAYMGSRYAEFVPRTDWNRVAFVWGLAFLLWAIAAVAFIVTKVSASLLSSVVYRLTDIAARPVHVVDESPRIRPGVAQPTFRDPGQLKDDRKPGTGEFVAYDEATAFIQTMAEDLKATGMTDEQINEVLTEYRKANPG